ncbi:MAG TPA: ABC transporter permease [Candidatus Krumholzibacteria bacterium]|nr:ABC transporter permease [Candidatus Krumholzibacteria bacterium]
MELHRKRESLWRENVVQAVQIIRAHRMRSGLLILGVAIGITTILMIVTVLSGLSRKIYHDLASANRPYIYVSKYDLLVEGDEGEEQARRRNFTREEAQKVAELCPDLDTVEFMIETDSEFVLRYEGEKTPPTAVIGCGPGLLEIFTLQVDRGRFISESDVAHRDRVVVLAAGPARDLFKLLDPVGRYITVGGQRYRVIGTLASRRHIFGGRPDNFVAVPVTTFAKDLQKDNHVTSIGATVRDGITLDEGVDEATRAMRVARGLRPGQKDDFAVTTSEAFIDLVKRVTVPIGIVLTIIASIGLVVGGIGVMNIMLISVTERTREIGVRRAIGAGRGDIMLQFLVESGMLTGIGGIVGVVFGTVFAYLVSRMLHFPFYFSVPWTLTALLFSVMVGVGFGLYPARRAGDMDPVAALRYE